MPWCTSFTLELRFAAILVLHCARLLSSTVDNRFAVPRHRQLLTRDFDVTAIASLERDALRKHHQQPTHDRLLRELDLLFLPIKLQLQLKRTYTLHIIIHPSSCPPSPSFTPFLHYCSADRCVSPPLRHLSPFSQFATFSTYPRERCPASTTFSKYIPRLTDLCITHAPCSHLSLLLPIRETPRRLVLIAQAQRAVTVCTRRRRRHSPILLGRQRQPPHSRQGNKTFCVIHDDQNGCN